MTAQRTSRLLAWPLLLVVRGYRRLISPLIGNHCRFQPTCSDYAEQALGRYGAWRGGWLALRRILRCHPWGASGYDPLPGGCASDEDRQTRC